MAADLGVDVGLIERGKIGGQARPIPTIHNLAGFTGSGLNFAGNLDRQLQSSAVEIHRGEASDMRWDRRKCSYTVTTEDRTHTAQHLILAMGARVRPGRSQPTTGSTTSMAISATKAPNYVIS